MSRFFSFFFLFLLSFALSDCNDLEPSSLAAKALPSPEPAEKSLPPNIRAFLKNYDDYFSKSLLDTDTPGAAIAIVKDGKVIFQKGYGVQSNYSGEAVDTNTVFRIGSLSKGFAAALTGLMVQRGLLEWNDNVQQFVPDFTLKNKDQAARIQVKHILSHTEGLSYHAFSHSIEEGKSIHDLIFDYFPNAKTYAKEGTQYTYQNAAFSLIQPILEEATKGQSYPALLETEIFQKNNMQFASCTYEELMATQNKALPHKYGKGGWLPQPILPNYYGDFCAAGGVNASISDMGKYLEMMMGSRPHVLADATREYLFMPLVETGSERRVLAPWVSREDCHYGLGWRVLYPGDDTVIYHGGYVNGYHSEIAFSRQYDIGIVFLANAKTRMSNTAIKDFFLIWQRFAKWQPQS